MNLKEAYKMVFEDMSSKVGMFTGKYDAKNGGKHFMFGISTVMEFIAYNVDEQTGIDFEEQFTHNMIESERKGEQE